MLLVLTSLSEAEEFKPLPSEEDWRGSDRALKDMRLGKDTSLSVGGSARVQFESYLNPSFGDDPSDSYLLTRLTLHSDLRIGRDFRFFADVHSAMQTGVNSPSPVDQDHLFLHQVFLEQKFGEELSLRAGRQEVTYGSGRLVSVREGPNIRRSFEGLRGTWSGDEERLDAFWFRPTTNLTGAFNNRWLDAPSWLAGAYYHRLGQEYYIMRYQDARASFQDATGIEERWTVGGRWFGTPEPWSYDFEAFYQFGTIGASDIRAWSIASNTSYQVESWPGSPRFSLKANVVSGDGAPDDDRLNTFNAMFPNGSYFGEIALLGPANLLNLHPGVTFELTDTLELDTRADFFWRFSLEDGIYAPSGQLIRAGDSNDSRFIGIQPDITLTYRPSPSWELRLNHSVFFPGSFIADTGSDETVQFTQISVKYRF